VYCGIDSAEGHHGITLVGSDGTLVAKRCISESVNGVAELTALLAAGGDSAAELIPSRSRPHAGCWWQCCAPPGGRSIRSSRWPWPGTGTTPVSGKKSNQADAVALANILRTDVHLHRKLPDGSGLARSVSVLARAHQDAVWRRTKLVQELRARLREYYPGFLAAFAAPGSGRRLRRFSNR
jgi:Transposase